MTGRASLQGPCQYLVIDQDQIAYCEFVRIHPAMAGQLGVGKGCCMKGRIYDGKTERDIAELSDADKRKLVRSILAGQAGLIANAGTLVMPSVQREFIT